MKKFLVPMLAFLVMFALMSNSSCDSTPVKPSADKQMQAQTEKAMVEGQKKAGYPAVTKWTEKQQMKTIYEERDRNDLICYAYYFNVMEGKRGDFIGKCIGYGIPYSTQFSNPEKMSIEGGLDSPGTTGDREELYIIQQPEPNGLFMPTSSSATWLFLIDPNNPENDPAVVYMEPLIIVSPFKMH